MYYFELIFFSFCLYLFFTIQLVPIGLLLANKFISSSNQSVRILSSFGFSILFYSVLLLILIFFNLSNSTIQKIIMFLFLASTCLFCLKENVSAYIGKEGAKLFILFFIYFLMILIYAAFPNGNFFNVTAANISTLTGLPIDNLIPYNMSRYIIERINPNKIEIVPGWSASERGPVAGIITAVTFILLGLKESSAWLTTSNGVYFIYQALISYLNLTSLLAVYVITRELVGRKAAFGAVFCLSLNYFYFVNILYTWPKFLMAYFTITAFLIFLNGNKSNWNAITTGLFLGLAMLAHDSAAFSIGAFFLFCFVKVFYVKAENIKSIVCIVISMLVVLLPWSACKVFFELKSGRGIEHLLFCSMQVHSDNNLMLSFNNYLSQHSIQEIIKYKINNIFFPFDLSLIAPLFKASSALGLIHSYYSLAFLRLSYGMGLPIFILSFFGFFFVRKYRGLNELLVILFLTLVVSTILIGCKDGLVNHYVGYVPYMILSIFAGVSLAKLKRIGIVLIYFGVLTNIFIATVYLIYDPRNAPFLHGSEGFFCYLMLCLICYLLMLSQLFFSSDENE